MALVNCNECGKEISDQADACPNCGSKPTKTSALGVFVTIVLLVIVIGGILGGNDKIKKSPEEQRAADEQNQRIARAQLGANALKTAMRNPDSFKLEQALLVGQTGAICYEYRAQNGFGGMNRDQAVLTKVGNLVSGSDRSFDRVWKDNCADRTGVDFAKYVL